VRGEEITAYGNTRGGAEIGLDSEGGEEREREREREGEGERERAKIPRPRFVNISSNVNISP
jgi:hypothetical protein